MKPSKLSPKILGGASSLLARTTGGGSSGAGAGAGVLGTACAPASDTRRRVRRSAPAPYRGRIRCCRLLRALRLCLRSPALLRGLGDADEGAHGQRKLSPASVRSRHTARRRHAATQTSRVMRVCGTLCTVGDVGAAPLPPSLPEAPAPAGHAWTSTSSAAVSAPASPASGPLTLTCSPLQALAWGTQGAEAKPVHEHPFHGAHGRRRRRWGDGAARA